MYRVKALVKLSPAAGDLAVRPLPVPDPRPGEALVQVTAVGLCGSDVHAIRAHPGYEWVRTPVTLGHEITGVVAAVAGDAREVPVGSQVGVISMDGCRACDLCVSGRRPLCAERTVIGLSDDGGAADYVLVRADNLVPLPAELSWRHSVLLEPFSVAVHAVARTPLPADGRVIVSGAGPVGILAAFAARAAGAEVTVVGVAQDEAVRLPLLRQAGFATRTEPPAEPAGAWIEASGSVAALAAAVAGLGTGGDLTAVGMYDRLAALDGSRIVRREITFRGSYGSVAADYLTALGLLRTAGVPADGMVSPFPLGDWADALDAIARGAVIKAALRP
jgi:L-iditol 2-dehydrogenase